MDRPEITFNTIEGNTGPRATIGIFTGTSALIQNNNIIANTAPYEIYLDVASGTDITATNNF